VYTLRSFKELLHGVFSITRASLNTLTKGVFLIVFVCKMLYVIKKSVHRKGVYEKPYGRIIITLSSMVFPVKVICLYICVFI